MELQQGQQLRPLAVVAADLVQRLGDALQLGGGLGLDDDDRDAVDEEDHVQADVGGVPLVKVNSSVTWKVLASTWAGSSSRTLRSRFSASHEDGLAGP